MATGALRETRRRCCLRVDDVVVAAAALAASIGRFCPAAKEALSPKLPPAILLPPSIFFGGGGGGRGLPGGPRGGGGRLLLLLFFRAGGCGGGGLLGGAVFGLGGGGGRTMVVVDDAMDLMVVVFAFFSLPFSNEFDLSRVCQKKKPPSRCSQSQCWKEINRSSFSADLGFIERGVGITLTMLYETSLKKCSRLLSQNSYPLRPRLKPSSPLRHAAALPTD